MVCIDSSEFNKEVSNLQLPKHDVPNCAAKSKANTNWGNPARRTKNHEQSVTDQAVLIDCERIICNCLLDLKTQ